jgi:signal transduction histidine kinase
VTDTTSINLVHPNASLVGTKTGGKSSNGNLTDTQAYAQGLANKHIALVDVLVKRTQDGPLEAKLQGVVAVPAWGWWIGTGFFYDGISAAYWRLARALMVIAVVVFLAVGAMAWFMTRTVTRCARWRTRRCCSIRCTDCSWQPRSGYSHLAVRPIEPAICTGRNAPEVVRSGAKHRTR